MTTYISYDDAVTQICNMLIEVSPDYDTPRMRLSVQSFVKKVLDYCHRDDFPDTLLYTAVDFVMKNIEREAIAKDAPVKAIQEKDNRIEFAVNSVPVYGIASDEEFKLLRPTLNLYRRLAR